MENKKHNFKWTTWSIVNREDLNNNEKIALAFINAATPIGGIRTALLHKYLGVAQPTTHRILKSLVAKKEIELANHRDLWVVTSTEKLF